MDVYAPKGYLCPEGGTGTGDEAMKSDLSAFLDDELEAHQQHAMLAAVGKHEELRCAWDGYHLIGDALRRTPGLDSDLTGRVMSCLQNEPVVLAPQVKGPRHLLRATLTLAATAAGVAVVAWLALAPPQQETIALAKPGKQAVSKADSSVMQKYLVAHQAYSPSNGIQGGTAYVRGVSATRDSAAR